MLRKLIVVAVLLCVSLAASAPMHKGKSFLVTVHDNGAIEIWDVTEAMDNTPRHQLGPVVYQGVSRRAALATLKQAIKHAQK